MTDIGVVIFGDTDDFGVWIIFENFANAFGRQFCDVGMRSTKLAGSALAIRKPGKIIRVRGKEFVGRDESGGGVNEHAIVIDVPAEFLGYAGIGRTGAIAQGPIGIEGTSVI